MPLNSQELGSWLATLQGWPWLGSTQVCEVMGVGGESFLEAGKKMLRKFSALLVGKLSSWGHQGFRYPYPRCPCEKPELDSRSLSQSRVHPGGGGGGGGGGQQLEPGVHFHSGTSTAPQPLSRLSCSNSPQLPFSLVLPFCKETHLGVLQPSLGSRDSPFPPQNTGVSGIQKEAH